MRRLSSNKPRIRVFFLTTCLTAAGWAGPPGRSVDFRFEDQPLVQAVDSLIGKYKIPLVYQSGLLAESRITAKCRSCSVEQALNKLFSGTPFQWQRVGDQYIVVRQQTALGHLNGRVFLQDSPLPLGNAKVQLFPADEVGGGPRAKGVRHQSLTTLSSPAGHFCFKDLVAGFYRLKVSAPGFSDISVEEVEIRKNFTVDLEVAVREVALPLLEMVVVPSYYPLIGEGGGSRQYLNREEINRVPNLGNDIFRVMERLPGVTAATGSADFGIRGGNNGEVLVLVDGAEIENPMHLKALYAGMVSIIDTSAVGSLELLTGGFPAEYGNKMSGVFNISTATPDARRTSIGADLFNARFKTEGRFGSGRGSYLLSVRSGFFDLAHQMINEDPNDRTNANFDDMVAKFQYQLTDRHVLSTHLLLARDKAEIVDPVDLGPASDFESLDSNYASHYAWINLQSNWTESLSSQTVIASSDTNGRVQGSRNYGLRQYQVEDARQYRALSVKQDWSYYPNEIHFFKWGVIGKSVDSVLDYHNIKWDYGTLLNANTGEVREYAESAGRELGVYLSDRARLTSKLTLQVGVRYDEQTQTGGRQFSPRVNLTYSAESNRSLKFSWGRFYQSQGTHELQVEDGVDQYYPAQLAEHFICGFHRLLKNGIEWRGEIYLKNLTQIWPRFENELDSTADFPETQADRFLLRPESGSAQGIELILMRRGNPRFNWMVNYSLARAKERIERQLIHRQRNQLHTMNVDLNYAVPDSWNFNLSWHYHTGWRTTPVDFNTIRENGGLEFEGYTGPLYGIRYPGYHRMDFRASRQINLSKGRQLSFFLEVANLYNRSNVRSYSDHRVFLGTTGNPNLEYQTREWQPLLPSAGFNFSF